MSNQYTYSLHPKWTEERIGELERLWADGLSASQIACRIGGVSRNAVIGKIHRLGLVARSVIKRKPVERNRSRRSYNGASKSLRLQFGKPQPKSAKLFQSDGFIPPPEEVLVPPAERISSVEGLSDNQCRWIIGHVGEPDWHFCNGKQVEGLSYCECHARRAYVPPSLRRNPIAPPAFDGFNKSLVLAEFDK